MEATFKEDVSVYFDENPHDRLQETHNVDKSLEGKLKCLIFIPILSQTYCDPSSYAWQNEFLAFIEMAEDDRFGKDVKLRSGNVASRILPIRIHDLEPEDVKLFEKETGTVLRAMDFVFKTASGVNRPLLPDDNKNDNLNKTLYRDQINKVAGAIKEIILSLTKEPKSIVQEKVEKPAEDVFKSERKEQGKTAGLTLKSRRLLLLVVSLFLIIAGAVAIYNVINNRKVTGELTNLDKSIAVLPFVNDSPDTNNLYFCNGMMEDILNHLVRINDLEVKSRTSVEKYRNPNKDIIEIGRELKVSLILEGSVRKVGDDLRIATQLIDAKTDDHLWSEIYDGKYSAEIFEFQSNIARKVAASLNAVITPQEGNSIVTKPKSDIASYDLYLRGMEMCKKWNYSFDSLYLKLGLNLFNQALIIDSNNVKALGGKGYIYREEGKFDSAIIVLEKANRIDPVNLPGAGGIGSSTFVH